MFKLKWQKRIQCEGFLCGLSINDSLNLGPCYAERPNWRVTLWLGWGRLTARIYRTSKPKWAGFLKAHHLPLPD